MSSPLFLSEVSISEPVVTELQTPPISIPARSSRDVAQQVISGTSTLGAAIFLERGATFAANILAARFGGVAVFGAYSLGISTANNISTYAAGGIGATATRFSGKYSYEGPNYAKFARVLAFVSVVSASVAACALLFGAAPIAHFLHKETLTVELRWAALSAAGMLLLECVRGFFVGQRRLLALAVLSVAVGIGMLALLPALAARKSPAHMIAAHGTVTLGAVAFCLLLPGPLALRSSFPQGSLIGFGAMLREVWGFGFIQLSGLLSANLAGWWITALVARGDTSLVEMGFFAIASQLRNITGVIPGLLTEGSYAAMATPDEEQSGVPQRVMALCTFAATSISFLFASLGILVAPWALKIMYGTHYGAASVAVSIGMSVAVLQMGNAPPSALASVVSIRSIAVINTVWAVFTAVAGTLLMTRWANAATAMAVFFAAHLLISALVLVVLKRKKNLPSGLVPLFLLSTIAITMLSALAVLRQHDASMALGVTGVMTLITAASLGGLFLMARKYMWLFALSRITSLLAGPAAKVRALTFARLKGRS